MNHTSRIDPRAAGPTPDKDCVCSCHLQLSAPRVGDAAHFGACMSSMASYIVYAMLLVQSAQSLRLSRRHVLKSGPSAAAVALMSPTLALADDDLKGLLGDYGDKVSDAKAASDAKAEEEARVQAMGTGERMMYEGRKRSEESAKSDCPAFDRLEHSEDGERVERRHAHKSHHFELDLDRETIDR